MTGLILVPDEPHVSFLALIVVLVIMSIPEWLALYVWWKVKKELDAKLRELAEDRVAGSRHDPGDAGRQEEKGTQHVTYTTRVQHMPLDWPSVARRPDWGPFTSLPEVRKDPPPARED